jgi:hypothetical protein
MSYNDLIRRGDALDCIPQCGQCGGYDTIAALPAVPLARWRDEAVQAEREACAEAVESLWAYRTCSEVAAAIRARKGGEV